LKTPLLIYVFHLSAVKYHIRCVRGSSIKGIKVRYLDWEGSFCPFFRLAIHHDTMYVSACIKVISINSFFLAVAFIPFPSISELGAQRPRSRPETAIVGEINSLLTRCLAQLSRFICLIVKSVQLLPWFIVRGGGWNLIDEVCGYPYSRKMMYGQLNIDNNLPVTIKPNDKCLLTLMMV
jgi:hypothetical protein